ncbi:hypothetical protein GUJ93_ZPchr0008g14175 [Zizania palustris]|uniref:Uncharacterized protein n=1 Tax=Zizania palustris TaxID=103762 RepID=A0A8J5RBR0_ZIZPA|nr:hypothetical protein GUJ93_ZPchr0008g14175 [Zizania palustris]
MIAAVQHHNMQAVRAAWLEQAVRAAWLAAGGVPRARRRRRWLAACASALAGGVRVGAGVVWRRAAVRGVP